MNRSFPFASRMFKVLALASVVTAAPLAAASADYYLKLGDIKGESKVAARSHKDEIDILSWSWGASNAGALTHIDILSWSWGQTNSGSARTNKVEALTVKQGRATSAAKSTPKLADATRAGSVTVSGRLPGCSVGAEYVGALLGGPSVRYELRDVAITSCADGSVSLDYASIRELSPQTSAR